MPTERNEIPIHGTVVLPDAYYERLEKILQAVADSTVNAFVTAMQKERAAYPSPAATVADAAGKDKDTALSPLLNAKGAATYLGIGAYLLWSLTNRGEIPCVRIGRCVRYDLRDLIAWIDQQKRRHRRG